jgi:ATP-dependent Clp protease ATP-binding subunit ClpA
MFERFTKRARTALVLAQQESAGLGHGVLDTAHILLGVLAEGEGIAAKVLLAEGLTLEAARQRIGHGGGAAVLGDAEALATIGIDLDSITAAVEAAFGEGALERALPANRRRLGNGAPFTPKAKKALELALREALSLGHNYIGTEHLLLGLVRMKEGVGYEVIAAVVADPTTLRQKVLDELTRLRPGA